MNERLKKARKALKLSQSDFGKRLGVTDGAISHLERGVNNLTDQIVAAVCREFGINEEWLRTGAGEMFVENDGTILAALAVEYNLDDLDRKIVEAFLKLPEIERTGVRAFVVSLARRVEAEHIEQFHSDIVNEVSNHTDMSATVGEVAEDLLERIFSAKQEIFGVGEDEENLHRIVEPPELTDDEKVELYRQRLLAAKRGAPSSTTSEKQA